MRRSNQKPQRGGLPILSSTIPQSLFEESRPVGQRREGISPVQNWGFQELRNMKKPDSLQYQLKTLQSERNLARGSEKEIEGGAIKLEAAAVDSGELFSRRSISGIAAVVASRGGDFRRS